MLTALCGWFGDTGARGDAHSNVEGMGRRLSPSARADLTTHVDDRFALAAIGAHTAGNLIVRDRQCAVLCGTPRWSDPALQRHAERYGHAAALLEAYREHGASLYAHLHDAFACVILDAPANQALLAVDRMGIYPLAFAVDARGAALAFGSTTTSIHAHPAFKSALDPKALYAYLYFHVVPSPLAVFAGQQKLLPGQYMRWRAGQANVATYWNPEFNDDRREPWAVLEAALRERLRRAIERVQPDQRTGAFLSGGVDSSTVAGLLAETSSAPAQTFSIGFDAVDYDEMGWARISARHFGTRQHEYYVTPGDVLATIPKIAAAYDEPFGNSSAVPVYHCARLACSQGIEVMLAGDGGDELFGGNTRYAKQKIFEIYQHVPAAMRAAIEPTLERLGRSPATGPLYKARRYVEQARIPMPDRLETYNFLYRTRPEELLHPEFLASVDTCAPLALLRDTYARARSGALVNRMLYLDWKFTLADNDLRKVNRMCEFAGVSVRYPLLDDELVQFSIELPARLKVRGTQLRYFFKHALRDFLPRAVLTKPKHGFGLPFGVWMKNHRPLQELAYDSLNRLARRPYVRADYLTRLMTLHREQHAAYYGEFMWVLMMLELWLTEHERPSANA